MPQNVGQISSAQLLRTFQRYGGKMEHLFIWLKCEYAAPQRNFSRNINFNWLYWLANSLDLNAPYLLENYAKDCVYTKAPHYTRIEREHTRRNSYTKVEYADRCNGKCTWKERAFAKRKTDLPCEISLCIYYRLSILNCIVYCTRKQ